jgi:hypothetical protein
MLGRLYNSLLTYFENLFIFQFKKSTYFYFIHYNLSYDFKYQLINLHIFKDLFYCLNYEQK